jgi:hypothetical protein
VLPPALLALAALAAPVAADVNFTCGSEVTAESGPRLLAQEARRPAGEPEGEVVYFLPVTFHIVRNDDGSGGLDPARLPGFLARLNAAFAPSFIQFCQPGPPIYIDSTDLNNITSNAEGDVLRQTGPVADTINVFFADNLHVCGQASFSDDAVQGVIMQNTCQGTDQVEGILVHEVGHYFDLYHTHETFFGTECVDGSNCATAGDLVCDTPADFNLGFTACVNAACMLTCTTTAGPCPDDGFYVPSTTNYMSYSRALCLSDFTPSQSSRARVTLLTFRQNLIQNQCSGNVCGDAGNGSCFFAHATPGCDDGQCCQRVCALDPYCCNTQWDAFCVQEAQDLCGCGTDLVGPCDQTGPRPGCDDPVCCEVVCAFQPACCTTAWDPQCVILANLLCNADPGDECLSALPVTEGDHPLTTADNGGLNPDDSSCGGYDPIDEWYAYTASCTGPATASICGFNDLFGNQSRTFTLSVFSDCLGNELVCSDTDPACGILGETRSATVTWNVVAGQTYYVRVGSPTDETGPGTLRISCNGCGLPDAGDCFANNGTPGCGDPECCFTVCALDPYCCETAWDSICANLAASNCAPPCPTDTDGNGATDVNDLLAVLGAWGPCPAPCPADIDASGTVDVADLLAVLGDWGPCGP